MAFGNSEQPETDSPLSMIPDTQTTHDDFTRFSHRTLLELPRGTASGSHPEGLTPQVWVWLGVMIFQPLPSDAATQTSVCLTPWEHLLP